MKWEPTDCRTGDMIRIRLGSIYHYGVFLSEDEVVQFGYPPIAAYQEQNAVVTVLSVDIDSFACGHIVEVAVLDRRERKKRLPPAETARRARARLGEGGYNIIHNNCEHFAYECVFGEKKSEQTDAIRQFWREKLGK
ncbi:MAG: lecithin retinol acyltransferase family protein [Ruminococcus sp.]|nr:lecithin retinol acyltransferase family protein [Ruminococcus sp.]